MARLDPTAGFHSPSGRRAIGVLNLLVGGFLTVVSCSLLYFMLPFLKANDPLQIDRFGAQAFVDELRTTTLGNLRDDEADATDPAVKSDLKKAIAELEASKNKVDDEFDLDEINRGLPWITRYLWADLVSAPLISMLLAVSGVGLILRKNWGGLAASIAASLKIARLFALGLFLLITVVPRVGNVVREFAKTAEVDAFIRYGTNRVKSFGIFSFQLTPSEVVEIATAAGQGYAIGMFFFGIIYPLIVLIVLNRKQVRPPGSNSA